MDKFHNILRMLSNEVVHRAIAMVGEDILREPLEVIMTFLNWSKMYTSVRKIMSSYEFN